MFYYFRLIAFFVLIQVSDHIFAHDFIADGFYIYISSKSAKEVYITNRDGYYNSYSGDLVIPETVTGYGGTTYTVTGIYPKAFKGCNKLNSLTIPKTVKCIGSGAFDDCI